jgi:hypothetical protein
MVMLRVLNISTRLGVWKKCPKYCQTQCQATRMWRCGIRSKMPLTASTASCSPTLANPPPSPNSKVMTMEEKGKGKRKSENQKMVNWISNNKTTSHNRQNLRYWRQLFAPDGRVHSSSVWWEFGDQEDAQSRDLEPWFAQLRQGLRSSLPRWQDAADGDLGTSHLHYHQLECSWYRTFHLQEVDGGQVFG